MRSIFSITSYIETRGLTKLIANLENDLCVFQEPHVTSEVRVEVEIVGVFTMSNCVRVDRYKMQCLEL